MLLAPKWQGVIQVKVADARNAQQSLGIGIGRNFNQKIWYALVVKIDRRFEVCRGVVLDPRMDGRST